LKFFPEALARAEALWREMVRAVPLTSAIKVLRRLSRFRNENSKQPLLPVFLRHVALTGRIECQNIEI